MLNRSSLQIPHDFNRKYNLKNKVDEGSFFILFQSKITIIHISNVYLYLCVYNSYIYIYIYRFIRVILKNNHSSVDLFHSFLF
ncbi:unnamed protein product [Nezara viridula]|uniref:Uncharacterized protein n=1 Tax=Nezara viridula TaxID=85310 RepID=A0A9P0MSS0_NEZVI|nr:unnamed protein product [Nezara viridula]